MPSNRCKEQAGPHQRKQRRNSEEKSELSSEKARPAKRARNSVSTVSDKPQPLDAKSLERHTVREGCVDMLERMDSESGNIRGSRGSNRSSSRSQTEHSSTASAGVGDLKIASQVTQKSCYTAAHYRLSILAGVNIIFRFHPAQEYLCTRVDAVVQCPVIEERKEELSRIAHALHNQFAAILGGEAGEDDCIEPFHQTLSALSYDKGLLLPRKAGMMT